MTQMYIASLQQFVASEAGRAASEAGRADEATKRADMASAHLVAQKLQFDNALSKYQMQYCWRSVLECLLRSLADVSNTSPGGALYKQHLLDFVLQEQDLACVKFSPAALALYEDIIKYPTFSPCNKDGRMPSFVAALKDIYNIANDDCHMLPEIVSEVGVACGGGGPEKMLKHAFVVASLQKSCLEKNKPIPRPFDKVAVLSASLDTVVAHVINGKYVPKYV